MISSGTRIYSVKEIFKMCEDGFSEEFISYYERTPNHIKWFIYNRASDNVRQLLSVPEGMEIAEAEVECEATSANNEIDNVKVENDLTLSNEDENIDSTDEYVAAILRFLTVLNQIRKNRLHKEICEKPFFDNLNKMQNAPKDGRTEISRLLSVLEQIAKQKENIDSAKQKEVVIEEPKKPKVVAIFRPENKAVNIKKKETVKPPEAVIKNKAEKQIKEPEITVEKEISEVSSPYADLEFGWKIEVDELWLNVTDKTFCSVHSRPHKQIQVMTRFAKTKKYGAVLECCEECKKLYITEYKLREYENIFKKKGICYHIEKGEK